MNVPNPPFRTVTEELLYNIYLKLQGGSNTTGLIADDINTIAKLNSILQDADLVSAEQITSSIAVLTGNVPSFANTLEKLYNIIQGITYLKREDIDTIAELNAILSDADLVRISDLADALVALNLKRKTIQFYFSDNHWDDDNHHNNNRCTYFFQGRIHSLTEVFTNELSALSYKSRLDNADVWTFHSNLPSLQNWINNNVTGNEFFGTKYWIKCLPGYRAGRDGEAAIVFSYTIA